MSAVMTVIARAGGPEDVEAAVSVYVRAGMARRGGAPAPDWRIDEVRGTLKSAHTWFFVVHEDSEAVGMAAAMQSLEEEGAGPPVPGLCYLDLIFVVPERWGSGIGALLLDTVIADARGRGFSRIHLLTHDDNERAHGLYASRGFERTGWARPSRMPGADVSEWARRSRPLSPRFGEQTFYR